MLGIRRRGGWLANGAAKSIGARRRWRKGEKRNRRNIETASQRAENSLAAKAGSALKAGGVHNEENESQYQ